MRLACLMPERDDAEGLLRAGSARARARGRRRGSTSASVDSMASSPGWTTPEPSTASRRTTGSVPVPGKVTRLPSYICGVGEGDEALVEGAVVPRQPAGRQRRGQHVEHRLEALGERLALGAALLVDGGGEERRRRQLTLVAGDDDLVRARDRRDGLRRRDLRRLVEDDDVEPAARRQHRGDDERAHRPGGLDRGEGVPGTRQQVAQRAVATGLAGLGAHDGLLVGVVGEDLAQASAGGGAHPIGRARRGARGRPRRTRGRSGAGGRRRARRRSRRAR